MSILRSLKKEQLLVLLFTAVVYLGFSVIRKDSRYTEKDAAVVVRQMLKVAAECHLHGLVHRDMKPEVYSSTLAWIKYEVIFWGHVA